VNPKRTRPGAPVSVTGVPAQVQRCGGVTCPPGTCDHDDEVARHADGPSPAAVPASVLGVLGTSGTALDEATRTSMEGRFGYDFGRVRIHTDADAARSTTDIRATAYTFGPHIVMGAGRYQPHTSAGRELLAHELTHVVQQGSPTGPPTSISDPHDPAEQAAEQASSAPSVTTDARSEPRPAVWPAEASTTVHRQPAPASTNPDAGRAQSSAPAVWQMVSAADVTHIAALLKTPVLYGPGTGGAAPRFVIHDTGVTVGDAWIRRQVAEAHAQHGEGAAAYVPRTGPSSIARPSFFDPRRPATTQFERVNDLMDKPTREATYRSVWRNASAAVRTTALAAAVRDGLSPVEQAEETATAQRELNAGSGDVHTTGAWAATEICGIVQAQGAPAAANSQAVAVPLQAACIRLAPVIAARRERIGSMMNVEIAQETGSTRPGKGPALPTPAYNDSQYEDLALLYLGAALQAYRWPQITTHFVVDRGIGDHIDPRCFDLGKLYRTIAGLMGHPTSTSYGIAPAYGTSATSTVWWDKVVCGGPAP
jgi:hypothetical protein